MFCIIEGSEYWLLEEIKTAPRLISDFLTYSEIVRGKSTKSIDEYYLDLRTFFRYILLSNNVISEDDFENADISLVTTEMLNKLSLNDLYQYLVYCKNVRGNNSTTRARKTSTLRIYFKYLHTNVHLISNNPAELLETPKLKKSLPKYLDLDESLKFLQSIDGPYKERDLCMMVLFLNCGLRLSELCALNLSSIRSDHTLRVVGKGNKERIVYLNQSCIDAINNYLPHRPNDGVLAKDKDALFLSKRKSRISNKTVQYIVKTTFEKAGLGGMGYSTHKLRHTAATLMYQKGGVDVRVIQNILGHQNLGTTQIYTHVSDKQIESASNANPLANINIKKLNNTEEK